MKPENPYTYLRLKKTAWQEGFDAAMRCINDDSTRGVYTDPETIQIETVEIISQDCWHELCSSL